jgi:hypothetical protein
MVLEDDASVLSAVRLASPFLNICARRQPFRQVVVASVDRLMQLKILFSSPRNVPTQATILSIHPQALT